MRRIKSFFIRMWIRLTMKSHVTTEWLRPTADGVELPYEIRLHLYVSRKGKQYAISQYRYPDDK